VTYTAGKWPEQRVGRNAGNATGGSGRIKKRGRWPDKSLECIDVLNALGNPVRFAVGNTDARLKAEYWGEEATWEFDRVPATRVRHLRLDVDMNRAYEVEDHVAVVDELRRERDILAALGYTAHFFRTANRGHQIVIPTPHLDRSVASLAMLMMRYALTLAERTPRSVVVDKSNLDALMRLPLGRHAASGSVGWMIRPNGRREHRAGAPSPGGRRGMDVPGERL